MARLTVNEIMTRIASTVNQEADAPNDGSSEWALWLSYINRSQDEWANSNDWEITRKYFYPTVTGTSTATVALPLDFKNLAGPVRHWTDNEAAPGNPREFPLISDENRNLYDGNTDKYVMLIGDNSVGKSLRFTPATLASGASLEVTYFSMPTSLASGTQLPVVPNPEFLIDRTIAFIFEARSDPRFQSMEAKAREKLIEISGKADEDKYANHSTPNYVTNQLRRQGFRVGRN